MPAITLSRDALLPALALAAKVGDRRSTIPILGNVKLSALGGRLTLRKTNLDMELSADLACAHDQDVAITLPSQELSDLARKLPAGCQITLTEKGQNWVVTAGRSRFSLPALPASDYPEMAPPADAIRFSLPAAALGRIVNTVGFAMSQEETRFYLRGIYMHVEQIEKLSYLVAAATDGHRLSRLAIELPSGAENLGGIIVPDFAVDMIKQLVGDKGTYDVTVSDKAIMISRHGEDGGVALVSRLIEATYPDYRRVIPTANPNQFLVDRKQLLDACDRVLTIASSKGNGLKFSFGAGEGDQIAISGNNRDNGGTADETIATELLAGAPVETGFSGRYCIDILKAMDCENTVLLLGDAGAPCVLQPDKAPDPAPTFVLMPMRM